MQEPQDLGSCYPCAAIELRAAPCGRLEIAEILLAAELPQVVVRSRGYDDDFSGLVSPASNSRQKCTQGRHVGENRNDDSDVWLIHRALQRNHRAMKHFAVGIRRVRL